MRLATLAGNDSAGQAKQAVGESSHGTILLSIVPRQFRILQVGLGPDSCLPIYSMFVLGLRVTI